MNLPRLRPHRRSTPNRAILGALSVLVALVVADPSSTGDSRETPLYESHTIGVQKVLVLINDFPDLPRSMPNQAFFDTKFEAVKAGIRRLSYGWTDLEMTVVPQVLRLPRNGGDSTYSYQQQMRDALAAAEALGYDPDDFDRHWLTFPKNLNADGRGTIGGKTLWVGLNNTAHGIHEFMHTYGALHFRGGNIQNFVTPGVKAEFDWLRPTDPCGFRYQWINADGIYRIYEDNSLLPKPGGYRAAFLPDDYALFFLSVTNPNIRISKGIDVVQGVAPDSSRTFNADDRRFRITHLGTFAGGLDSPGYVEFQVDLLEGEYPNNTPPSIALRDLDANTSRSYTDAIPLHASEGLRIQPQLTLWRASCESYSISIDGEVLDSGVPDYQWTPSTSDRLIYSTDPFVIPPAPPGSREMEIRFVNDGQTIAEQRVALTTYPDGVNLPPVAIPKAFYSTIDLSTATGNLLIANAVDRDHEFSQLTLDWRYVAGPPLDAATENSLSPANYLTSIPDLTYSGIYTFELTARDPAGGLSAPVFTNFIAINGTPAPEDGTPYENWMEGFAWPGPASIEPGADPDGDGLSNSGEFFHRGDPLAASGAPPAITMTPGDDGIRVRFGRNPAADGYPIGYETSLDLEAWDGVTPSSSEVVETLPDGTEVVETTLPAPGSGTVRCFVRIIYPE